MIETLTIKTGSRIEMIDITARVQAVVDRFTVREGLCMIFVPHTTAAVTINENADPHVQRDLMTYLAQLIPKSAKFRHSEGNSDSHIKVSLTGASELVMIEDGRLHLGTWQSIFFCEYDGPRQRRCSLKLLKG
ncbi:MAG: secondary thiamine-phosphate synthase enzyme YjbQ [bacterium]|nr:secondary thiamine-phosphate synthase enzyme YjbQ [bacterium]